MRVAEVSDRGSLARPDALLRLRAACLLAAVVASLPAFFLLRFLWESADYLGHGYVIPLSSLGLLVARRERLLDALTNEPAPRSGPLWVAAAVLVESVGVLSEVGTIAGIGVPLVFAATFYATGGVRALRAAALPVMLLVFMVPAPTFLQDRLLLGLKTVVIGTSVSLLQSAGFSIAATGNRLLVPGRELLVADACSGILSLVTLLPLGVVIAFLLSRGIWRRAVIVASILPIAVLGNIARVVLTVVLVSRYGMTYAEGAIHDSFGLATFVLGTLALLAIARALR